jgi:hypothetical protein
VRLVWNSSWIVRFTDPLIVIFWPSLFFDNPCVVSSCVVFLCTAGDRVGTFSSLTEVHDTKLCCGDQAVSSVARGMRRPASELSFTWKAPTLQERAAPGAHIPTGPVVIKATMARDPLSVGPDDTEDPGLVQVTRPREQKKDKLSP